MLEIPYLVAFIFAVVFAYYDIKKGEVENWVSYVPLAFGIVYWLIAFLLFHENFIFGAVVGATAIYIIGLGFYYFAGLGGADVRFLTVLGALLPASPQISYIAVNFPFFLVLIYNFFVLMVFWVLGKIIYASKGNIKQLIVNIASFFQRNPVLSSCDDICCSKNNNMLSSCDDICCSKNNNILLVAMIIYALICLVLFALFELFAFLFGFFLVCAMMIIISQQELFTAKIELKGARYSQLKEKELSQAVVKNGTIIAPAWSKINVNLLRQLKQSGAEYIYIKRTFLPAGWIFPLLVIFTYFFGAIGF